MNLSIGKVDEKIDDKTNKKGKIEIQGKTAPKSSLLVSISLLIRQ